MEKTTIYGLPLNPLSLLEQLAGASFCVSYAHRDKLGRQLDDAIRLVGEDQILLVKTETQANIRHEYHACRVGYDQAMSELICTGMTAVQADGFLFCREPSQEALAHELRSQLATKKDERWPGLVRVDGHLVDPKTDEVFIVKTSKRGRDYLSTITSARRIKKILKLAKA